MKNTVFFVGFFCVVFFCALFFGFRAQKLYSNPPKIHLAILYITFGDFIMWFLCNSDMFKLELRKTFLFTQLYVHVWHASLFPTICQCKTLCFGTQIESFELVLCYDHVDHVRPQYQISGNIDTQFGEEIIKRKHKCNPVVKFLPKLLSLI